jgi:uncharacterized protein involved in exopolysaccharide biosynthesis
MTDSNAFLPILVQYRWKIVLLTGIAGVIAAILCLLLPKEYKASASVVPTNSKLMDKQRMYDNHIQELYGAYGNSDDADRIHAIMLSSNVLNSVADSLSLTNHYNLTGKKNGKYNTIKKLQKQMDITSTEFGEIKLMVWDENPTMALAITQALITQTLHFGKQQLVQFFNQSVQALQQNSIDKQNILNKLDAAATDKRKVLQDEIVQSNTNIAAYQLAIINIPPNLIVIDQPTVDAVANKPNIPLLVIAAMICAAFTSMVWVILFGKIQDSKTAHVN